MTPFPQARALALSALEPARVARVPLYSAGGRFIAETVVANRPLPAVDNAAYDGYAIKSVETAKATREVPARFTHVDNVYAGMLPTRFINSGEAARIFTGAALPPGADCVVRAEETQFEGQTVFVYGPVEPLTNIRRRGEEIQLSQKLFLPGQRVDPYVVATLASIGLATAPVRPRPHVAILSIGDELAPPGQTATQHQVYDANGPLLTALATEAGAEVIGMARVPDNESAIRAAIERRLETAELIITVGGAAGAEKDHVKKVLRALKGKLLFDQVAIRPGRTVALGVLGGRPVAVLPSNPGAAALTFDQLVRPMLMRRQGVKETRRRIPVRLDEAQQKSTATLAFLPAKLFAPPDGGLPLASIPPPTSNLVLEMVGSPGWVLLPPGRSRFEQGEEVEMELYDTPTFEISK